MNKNALYAFLAILLYSVMNLVLEQKLSKFTHASILLYIWAIAVTLSFTVLIVLKLMGKEIHDPVLTMNPTVWRWVLLAGVLYFAGDLLMVAAYTNGANLFLVAGIVGLFPIVVSAMKILWVRYVTGSYEMANYWYITGYVLAFLAALCVAKGSVE